MLNWAIQLLQARILARIVNNEGWQPLTQPAYLTIFPFVMGGFVQLTSTVVDVMLVMFGATSPWGNSEEVVTYIVGLMEQPPDVQVSAPTAYVVAGRNDVTVVRFEFVFNALQSSEHTQEIKIMPNSEQNLWTTIRSSHSLFNRLFWIWIKNNKLRRLHCNSWSLLTIDTNRQATVCNMIVIMFDTYLWGR